MRVLLAAAPHRDTFGYSMPPPGLLRLGGELLRAGVDVALEDLAYRVAAADIPSDDRLADASARALLERGSFDVVGLSVMGATLPIALAIFERLRRERPTALHVLGGPGTTGIDRAILQRFPFVDVVVRGEGELTLVDLVRRARERSTGETHAPLDARDRRVPFDARGIAGITWRNADGEVEREADREPLRELSGLAPYAWHLLPPISAYKRITGGADGLVALDSGRGCVFDCSFCTIGRFWSRRSRVLPARKLVDEVRELTAMPGARAAYLCHDIFGANRGQANAFCEEMIERGIEFPWEVRARADHLDRDLLDLMGRAGCYRVLIGVESADARVREANQKGMRADVDMLEVVADCARAGITPILSLILGLPGEDEPALRASLDLCARASLHAGVNLSLHLVNPQPGCALGDEYGARSRPVDEIAPDMALGAGTTRAEREWIDAHPDLFSTWALLPGDESYHRNLAAIAAELPEVLMRYPRTFALLAKGRGYDTLDLYRAWRATAKSFETFARAARVALVDEMLRWEQAIVRAQARARGDLANPRSAPALGVRRSELSFHCSPDAVPSRSGEVLEVAYDLVAVSDMLRRGEKVGVSSAVGAIEEHRAWLHVRPSARGASTHRISRDVARVAACVDGRTSIGELEARHPGFASALTPLVDAGLIELQAARAGVHVRIESESAS